MTAVTRLCQRAILLHNGRALHDGPAHQVVGSYLRSGIGTTAVREWAPERAPGNDIVRLRAVRVRDEDGRIAESVDIRRPVAVEMEYDVLTPRHVLAPNLHFFTEEGVCAFVTIDLDPEWRNLPRPAGRFLSTVWIPGNFLSEGGTVVRAAVATVDPFVVHLDEPDVVAFHVTDSLDGDSARGDYAGPLPGAVRPIFRWTNRQLASSPGDEVIQ
jgi:lipopolysaccharide transport system ATP-binding protein